MAFASETEAYFCKTENTLIQDSQRQRIIATATTLALRNLGKHLFLEQHCNASGFLMLFASLVIHGESNLSCQQRQAARKGLQSRSFHRRRKGDEVTQKTQLRSLKWRQHFPLVSITVGGATQDANQGPPIELF